MKILDPFARQEVGSCFYLQIPQWDEDLNKQMFAAHFVVEKATQQFLNGEVNALDFCDLVEEVIDDMDGYLEEVNSNLERMLQGESFLELISI
ncbi:MAG: hypothetical protein F6K48_17660 [Okeania sp. SIO3H1]|nr:hypothetical protein [Okeania sp. SIO3H1]